MDVIGRVESGTETECMLEMLETFSSAVLSPFFTPLIHIQLYNESILLLN